MNRDYIGRHEGTTHLATTDHHEIARRATEHIRTLYRGAHRPERNHR